MQICEIFSIVNLVILFVCMCVGGWVVGRGAQWSLARKGEGREGGGWEGQMDSIQSSVISTMKTTV